MPIPSIRTFHSRAEFLALSTNDLDVNQFRTALIALGLTTPIDDISIVSFNTLLIEWGAPYTNADLTAVNNLVATFIGAATSDIPLVATNAGPVTASTNAPVSVIDLETPALADGTYQVLFSCNYRMQAFVAGDAARAIFTLTTAVTSDQQDHWDQVVVRAFNGAVTLQRTAGQILRAQLQICEVGPGAGVAEMTKARITIDQITRRIG